MDINTINAVQNSIPVSSSELGRPAVKHLPQEIGQSNAISQGNDEKTAESGKLEDAVAKANDIAQTFYNRHLNFSVDNETDKVIVKVVDNETGEVVRQIPPKEMMGLIAHFDKIKALLFSGKY